MAIITLNNNSLINADVGKVLQVVRGSSETQFIQISPTSNTGYFPSSSKIIASITPSSASSKIIIQFVATVYMADTASDMGSGLVLKESISGGSTTTIYPVASATYAGGLYFASTVASNVRHRITEIIQRTPSTTSTIDYEVGVAGYDVDSIRLNDTNSRGEIIVMEVAG
jgi:hypothetical protein